MKNGLLTIKRLKKYFPYKKGLFVKAVDGVDLQIAEGKILGLVGESGSGKSTIAYTTVGMYSATEGEMVFKGQDINKLAVDRSLDMKGEIQIVFQDPGSSLNPRRNIKQILEVPLKLHSRREKSGFPSTTKEILEEVGLAQGYLTKSPRSLGGGERQLIAIARSLATKPSLIILDEPTSALDVSIQAKVINRLLKLQETFNLSYLFITHDLSLMRNVADRVAIMYLGKLCEEADTAEFFQRPLHPYTRMLLSSIPVATEEEEKLKPTKIKSTGEIPSSVYVPSGCSFHLRCPEKMDICPVVDPEMKLISTGHYVRCHAVKPEDEVNQ